MAPPDRARLQTEMLAREERLRSLARALAQDPDRVDDLVQEVWVKALARPPRHMDAVSGWLARVVRTTFYQERRSESRRRRREASQAGAHPAAAAGLDAAEREVIQIVRRELASLREPYRTALVLRHFESLPPREIAARLGVPTKTVKTRLERGHAMLRERLERRHGLRREALAVALLRVPPRLGKSASRNAAGLVASAAAVAVAGVVFFAFPGSHPVPPSEGSHTSGQVPVAGGEGAPSKLAQTRSLADPQHAPRIHAPPARSELRGRVVDVRGRPVALATVSYSVGARPIAAGTTVATEPPVAVARSDASGRFRLELPAPPPAFDARPSFGGAPLLALRDGSSHGPVASLSARAPGMAPVFGAVVGPADIGSDVVLVVDGAVTYRGRVLGPKGPVAGCEVRFRPPDDLRERIGLDLAHGVPSAPGAVTDAGGRFVLVAPRVAGSLLVASHATLGGAVATDAIEPSSFVLEVRDLRSGEPGIHGRVRTGDGLAIAGAAVTDGVSVEKTDRDGRFEWRGGIHADRLVCVAPGFLPVERRVRPSDRRALDVVMDRRPRSIGGRVVDASGLPLSGVRIDLDRLTPLWDGAVETPVCVEHALVSRRAPGAVYAVSDERGRFEIDGLLERSYGLVATRPGEAAVVRIPAVRPGSADVPIVWPGPPAREWTVRVVDEKGIPLAGAEVEVGRSVSVLPRPRGPGLDVIVPVAAGETDALGRFVLRSDDALGLRVSARADGFLAAETAVDGGGMPAGATLALARAALARVDWSSASPAPDRVELLDDAGRVLPVTIRRGMWTWRLEQVELVGGRSEAFSAPAHARRLRFIYTDRNEEVPIALAAGEFCCVRP